MFKIYGFLFNSSTKRKEKLWGYPRILSPPYVIGINPVLRLPSWERMPVSPSDHHFFVLASSDLDVSKCIWMDRLYCRFVSRKRFGRPELENGRPNQCQRSGEMTRPETAGRINYQKESLPLGTICHGRGSPVKVSPPRIVLPRVLGLGGF